MAINVKMLAKSIIDAAEGITGDVWPEVRDVAEGELRRLAQSAEYIEGLLRKEKIDAERARVLFEIHRTAAHTALLTVESLTASVSDAVIRVALGLAGKAITRSAGVTLF
jgi:hypothetical protein